MDVILQWIVGIAVGVPAFLILALISLILIGEIRKVLKKEPLI